MVDPLFEESQRVSSVVVLVMIAILAVVSALLLWKFGSRGRIWISLGAATVFVGVLLAFMHMRTTVTQDGVTISLFHVFSTSIPADTIAATEAIEYNPLGDFGGWGLRFGPQGRAYSIRGDEGVQLTLSDGRKILIGSQRPDALHRAIQATRAADRVR